MDGLVGVICLAWWLVGLAYMFRDGHTGWGIAAVFIPVIAMGYAVYHFVVGKPES
jgi:hypothetical protein